MKAQDLYPPLRASLKQACLEDIAEARQELLQPLVNYARKKLSSEETLILHFICTHNSRRSQMAQAWAQAIAWHFNLNLSAYSGGTEVTAFNPRAVKALQKAGFQISAQGEENPHYLVNFSPEAPPLETWSKLYDDPANSQEGFAAIMTCSEADDLCPFIPNADLRVPLYFEDPKIYDDTPQEQAQYLARSRQIASELCFLANEIIS